MAIIANPLSCNTYLNLGDYFQKSCAEQSDLILRTTLVFTKMIARLFDTFVHTCLGTIKGLMSAVLAVYSIPAAVFGCTPIHHKVAKEASRHFGLALFFIADIFISPANITNNYPQSMPDTVYRNLELETICDGMDAIFDEPYQNTKKTIINLSSEQIHALDKENKELKEEKNELKEAINQLNKENDKLMKKYLDLLNKEISNINNEINAA